jgi:RNA polymerase sigma-70 factor (ECF subfamily)
MATRVDELRNGNGGGGSYADLDDRMLVLDFQTGNGSRDPAFAEIHRRYSGLARHICYRILANPNDAEDATQETMLRVLQGLGQFNGRYRLQPWVARIATNVSLDALRTRARRPQSAERQLIELDQEPDHAAEPSVLVEQLLERERVLNVLAELPDHHRVALVLREYEGRSHEEIGHALGLSSSQAKALIHRAKGSFRRAWDRSEQRGRGLVAIGPLFLWPFRASEWLRRLFGSATEAAAAASASPAAATTALSAGERVTAAAVVVVMAATVGVGTVALRHEDARKQKRQPVTSVAPSPPPPVLEPALKPEHPRPKREDKPDHATRTKPAKETAPVVEVAPVVSPSPSPSPSPTETPPPAVAPPPPAPPWSGAFSSSILGDEIALTQIDSRVDGTVGRHFIFSQATKGSYVDAEGAAQDLYIEYWGTSDGARGTANAWIFVDTALGRYRYDGNLSLAAATLSDDGTFTYSFSGGYRLVDGPQLPSESEIVLPHDGTLSLELHFWSDQTSLYGAALSLTEHD